MNKPLKGKIIGKFGSQTEFAKAIKEHEAVVSRVIHGHAKLKPEARKRWATALGCDDVDNLFQQRNK